MTKRWMRSALVALLAILLGAPVYPVAGATGLNPSGQGRYLPAAGKPGAELQITIPDTGLSEDEKIVHLLNRIGYGPRPSYALRASEGRPGDIERVKEMGLAAYIEQQLHPETIPDPEMGPRLAGFETLEMTPFELLATYPPPQILRVIEQRLAPQMGMDPEAAGTMFPELERFRARQQRRESGEEREDDPVTRELRRQQRMSPQERMQQAMSSPARIIIELSQAKLLRGIYSERQLQEVMTDFWFNHFNVFFGKGADRWLVTSYEYEAIRPHALGNFRDLLGATATHPAMLFYLDNWLSADPEADYNQRELQRRYAVFLREQGTYPGALVVEILQRRGMDTSRVEQFLELQADRMENPRRRGRRGRGADQRQQRPQQRRGLNENYARELLELHTLGVDGGYSQQDVIEVARCFTGWTILPLQFGPRFLYVDEFHDQGTKVVLDHKIENGGQRDGQRVLDMLARHPSTARFISTKLARRFVSDAPPESLVERMAATFLETDGDIRAVLRTMFSSEEFWSPEAVNAKVKTPFEFVVSAARATNAEVETFPPGLVMTLRGLGQPLYAAQPPTGYSDAAEAWVSTGGLLGRMKVGLGMGANRLPGVYVGLPRELLRAETTQELLGALSQQVLGRPASENTRRAVAAQLAEAQDEIAFGGRQMEARLALGWLLASPEFQRR